MNKKEKIEVVCSKCSKKFENYISFVKHECCQDPYNDLRYSKLALSHVISE